MSGLARWGQPPPHLAARFHPWQVKGWLMLARMLYLAFFAAERKPIKVFLEWCRQSGKNELAAAWDTFCLMYAPRWIRQGQLVLPAPPSGGAARFEAVHSAPTFKPGIMVAKRRLESYLDNIAPGVYQKEDGVTYRIASGSPASLTLVSAGPTANRRSLSATGYLRVDEVQHTSRQVYGADLSPLTSSTGAPEIHQGTRWPKSLGSDLALELQEAEREDGIPRYFRLPASVVAEFNPHYAKHYAEQVKRLGPKHPIVLGEYDIVDAAAAGDFLEPADYAKLFGGTHGPLKHPEGGKVYIAGIDFAGAAETSDQASIDPNYVGKRDCTCVRIGELDWRVSRGLKEVAPNVFEEGEEEYTPVIRVRYTILWPGRDPEDCVDDIVAILRLFRVCRAVGDKNGAGDGPCAMLEKRLGSFVFRGLGSNGTINRRLGLRLLGAISSGRFEDYTEETPGRYLAESRKQYLHLQKRVGPAKVGQQGSFAWGHPVESVPGEGAVHDDIPKADALMLEGGYDHLARVKPTKQDEKSIPHWDEAASYET